MTENNYNFKLGNHVKIFLDGKDLGPGFLLLRSLNY